VSELKAGARLDGGRPGHLLAPHVDHMLERCPASNADVTLEQQYDCVACGVGTLACDGACDTTIRSEPSLAALSEAQNS
jgi:hypothetical protein